MIPVSADAPGNEPKVASNVYVVMGSTGEYSDRSEWAVVAFLDEEKAKQHVIDAERRAKEIQVLRPSQYRVPPEMVNEFDSEMMMDYTGTSYYYLKVEVR